MESAGQLFVKECNEIGMLCEIISPDVCFRPSPEDYGILSAIYSVLHKAHVTRVHS